MTIEIADRLIKLRKQYGYSQEELADKLGLSRQAVSKWERAEASPDTDNLICLAKLYGISLDELLSTDEDLDTIVKEQVKKDPEVEEPKEEKVESEVVDDDEKKDRVHISDDEGNRVIINDEGVFLKDKKGNRVVINGDGVVCEDKDGHCVRKNNFKPDKFIAVCGIVESALGLLALVAYILLGSLNNMWFNGWVVFFLPEIICSIARAIHKKNANEFNMTFTAVFTFFFVCMVAPGLDANLWHPMWVVFLAIPVYHLLCSAIQKAVRTNYNE